jgi:hypothetical protein
LANASEDEKKKWLAKDGTDWSGAFGEDPAKYVDLKEARKGNDPNRSRIAGKCDGREGRVNESMAEAEDDDEDGNDDSDSDESDLGVVDATNMDGQANGKAGGPESGGNDNTDFDANPNSKPNASNGQNKKDLHRKQRGLMQWKPMRNLAFAKDEAKFAVRKTLKKGTLAGRKPDVETET